MKNSGGLNQSRPTIIAVEVANVRIARPTPLKEGRDHVLFGYLAIRLWQNS